VDLNNQPEASISANSANQQQPEIQEPIRTLETVQSQVGIVDQASGQRKRKAYSPQAASQAELNQPISAHQIHHQQAAESSASVTKIARLANQVAPQQFQIPAANQIQAQTLVSQSAAAQGLQIVRLANGQQQIIPTAATTVAAGNPLQLQRTQIQLPGQQATSRLLQPGPQIVQVPPQLSTQVNPQLQTQVNPQTQVVSPAVVSQSSNASINSAGRPTSVTQMALQTKDTTYTKIFVGGLPYHTTDASLREYFQVFGEIEEAVVITDRQTGKSRGYGFVTMVDKPGADRACKDPNPVIDGRKANVNLAYIGAKPRVMQTTVGLRIPQGFVQAGQYSAVPAVYQYQQPSAAYITPQGVIIPQQPGHVTAQQPIAIDYAGNYVTQLAAGQPQQFAASDVTTAASIAYTAAGYQAASHIQPSITSMATNLAAQQQQIIPQPATMLNPYQGLAGYQATGLQGYQPAQIAAAHHLATAQPIQQAAANFNN